MRFLAVDYGTRRIGLAVCDELEFGAFPLATVQRSRSLPHDLQEIARHATKEDAHGIVCGLPLNADGTKGKSADAAEQFARALARRTPVRVYLWDEFLTTAEAEEELIAMDVSRKRRRAVIDQMAAVHLLESFLRARRDGTVGDLQPLSNRPRTEASDGQPHPSKQQVTCLMETQDHAPAPGEMEPDVPQTEVVRNPPDHAEDATE